MPLGKEPFCENSHKIHTTTKDGKNEGYNQDDIDKILVKY
jgi:hypothetical protein